MDILDLFFKTVLLRPYVFLFLAAFLYAAVRLIGWSRTWRFWTVSWLTAFVCEFSSTRTGFPFGWYFYNGSTVGQELYLADVPFMDSLSFSFLLYAAYCLALCLVLPIDRGSFSFGLGLKQLQLDGPTRTGWKVLVLTALLFAFIDMVIDPIALRGDRWFLGKIYYYPESGFHFGVPAANYIGWFIVGLLSLAFYFPLERRLSTRTFPASPITGLLLGVGLYYGVLVFNLSVTFWIGEWFMGVSGLLMHLPVLAVLVYRVVDLQPTPSPSYSSDMRNEEFV
ncbi:MAG: carotenoid biosynthesis protein [Nitrospira sp.]|nr:carotenoid biosynthesis protein [Nitrospira sp.]